MRYQTSLFIFRQDLRIFDNTGLYHACLQSKNVLPVFIFDTEILKQLPAKDRRIGFLIDACKEVDKQLKALGSQLYVFYGNPKSIVEQLLATKFFDALFVNKSYDSYGQSRDGNIQLTCQAHAIDFHAHQDYLLVEPDSVEVRKVFTPFYKLWQKQPKRTELLEITTITTPSLHLNGLIKIDLDDDAIYNTLNADKNTERPIHLGQKRLTEFNFDAYKETRNLPAIDGSSRLSPYIRFGIISIRELHNIVLFNKPKTPGIIQQNGNITTIDKEWSNVYISELARREFRQHIAHHFPETKLFEFQEKRRKIKRNNNKERFEKWKEGKTGYPIVDAGMRQLKKMNRMHNRVRMIVASFLTKDLLIDRRRGEKHFADYLIDYDENVNYGNWQRSASVGADPKPLRIFNPILQSERFDPQATYILERCPELKGQDIQAIHNPLKRELKKYYTPIVDHYSTSKQAKLMYYHEQYELPK